LDRHIPAKVNVKKVLVFLLVTFVPSYLAGFSFLSKGGFLPRPLRFAALFAYAFFPLLATVVVEKLIYRGKWREAVGLIFKPNWWRLLAWLAPPAFVLLTIPVSLVVPGVSYSPDLSGIHAVFGVSLPYGVVKGAGIGWEIPGANPFLLLLLQGLAAGLTVNALAACGEEVGWRGFLQRELAPLGFWRSSWLIGLIWGI